MALLLLLLLLHAGPGILFWAIYGAALDQPTNAGGTDQR